jgi:hypothetical protein
MGVEGSSRVVRRGGVMRGQLVVRMLSDYVCCVSGIWEGSEGRRTEECSTAQEKMVSEYGFEYFQGLEERDRSLTSNFLGGAEEGIAARPEEVMVSGLDFWKSGRMKDWRMVVAIKSGAVSWMVWVERRAEESERVCDEDHGSRGKVKARRERRIAGSRS